MGNVRRRTFGSAQKITAEEWRLMGSMMGRWLYGMALFTTIAISRADAAEPAMGVLLSVSPVYRYVTVRLETGDEPMPQAITGAEQSELRDGFFLMVPLNENEELIETAHPDQPARWYLGYTVGKARAASRQPGEIEQGLSMVDFGVNYQEFVFYPDGGSASSRKAAISAYFSIYETSYAISVRPGSFISSLRAAYLYEHRSAAKIGMVVPGVGGNPDTVNNIAVSFPSAVGALIVRPAVIFEPSEVSAFRIAFSPQYTFYSNQNRGNPFLDKERLRLEAWLHFFPMADHSFRVQAGVYSDRIVRGEVADSGTELGVMFQLRRDIRPFDW